jgi:hypothetical protein
MELEGSIPNSQELSTFPYPEPDQSSHHFFFARLGRLSKESVQVRGYFENFATNLMTYDSRHTIFQ